MFTNLTIFMSGESHVGRFDSPNSFNCRGSGGVALEGAMKPPWIRPWTPSLKFLVIYSTWWYLPSKTHRKIDILKELLHSVREWHHFYELTWLRSPWEPLVTPSLPDASQRCLPDVSKFYVENTNTNISVVKEHRVAILGSEKAPAGSAHTFSIFDT